jgi:polysaccharide chain length determinant protein (PEP-CTERM system associated)
MQPTLGPAWYLLRDIWSRRWYGVVAAWVMAVVAAVVVVRTPERYEVTSRVYVDTQTVLQPLMQGLTVEPDIDQMVAMLARTLITRPKLEELIARSHVDGNLHDPKEREALIQGLTRDIKFTSTGGKNLYDIAYRDTDRQRALRIAQELVALFVSSGKGDKVRDTEAARRFIEEQIAVYEAKLEESENRLKEFKVKHFGVLGGNNQDYLGHMAAIQQELAQARVELRAAQDSRDALKRSLSEVESTMGNGGASPSSTPELDARIDAQQKELDELRRRFTDVHPDVVSARRLIVQLQEERARKLQALPAGAKSDTKPANPVYQQIKVKLAEADAAAASLRGRVGELSGRLAQLQASAAQVPKVEAEMAQLNRDYDVIKHNYEQLVQRRETGSISSDADASGRMAEFRVIEPPRVRPQPVFPSRLQMVAIALLLSLTAGAAVSYGMTQLMPTVRDGRTLRSFTERPMLGAISMVESPGMIAVERRYTVLFLVTLALLVVMYGAWGLKVLLNSAAT